jgi:hypothetical protein
VLSTGETEEEGAISGETRKTDELAFADKIPYPPSSGERGDVPAAGMFVVVGIGFRVGAGPACCCGGYPRAQNAFTSDDGS